MKNLMQWLRGFFTDSTHSKPDAAPDPVPAPDPAPAPAPTPAPDPAPKPQEIPKPDYKDPRYLKLAEQCAMGDIVAMWELAHWFRGYLRPDTAALLDAYNSGEDTYDELFRRTKYTSPDNFPLCAYLAWIKQAARYGHEQAQQISEERSLYRFHGLLKEATHKVGRFGTELYYASELHRLGLLDVDSSFSEFGICSLLPEGIFPASYLADYIPADSDGFGREDTYEDVYYDEFFNLIPGSTIESARRNLPALLKKREDYWADPKNDAEHRKYRQLWSEVGKPKK